MKRPRRFGQQTSPVIRRQRDAQRRQALPWRDWYGLKAWKDIRERQLAEEPLCGRCFAKGLVVEATVVNHRVPHKGDWERFITGPFESCCKPCHDSDVQREEKAASKAKGNR